MASLSQEIEVRGKICRELGERAVCVCGGGGGGGTGLGSWHVK